MIPIQIGIQLGILYHTKYTSFGIGSKDMNHQILDLALVTDATELITTETYWNHFIFSSATADWWAVLRYSWTCRALEKRTSAPPKGTLRRAGRNGHVKDMAKDMAKRPGKRVQAAVSWWFFWHNMGMDIHGYQILQISRFWWDPGVLIGFWSIPKVFINFSDCQGGFQSCLSMVLRYKDPRSPDRREWLDYDQVRIHWRPCNSLLSESSKMFHVQCFFTCIQ